MLVSEQGIAKIIKVLEHLLYEEKLRELFSLGLAEQCL